jgi:hypothetical protein
MSLIQVGLVDITGKLNPQLVQSVAAALNVQVMRDLPQYWNVQATVMYLPNPKVIPVGVWPVRLVAKLPPGEGGVHLDEHNQPYSLVIATPDSAEWTIDASHETLEMLVDPYGNRLQASRSIAPTPNGTVDTDAQFNYLVEACDPCEDDAYAYSIDGVAVSDFITPHFYDPIAVPGTRYSFTGAIKAPRQLLPGGYISFINLAINEWQQILWVDSSRPPTLNDLGPSRQVASFRVWVDSKVAAHRKKISYKRKINKALRADCKARRDSLSKIALQRAIKFNALRDSTPPNSAPAWSDFLIADTGMGESFDADQLTANGVLGIFHQVVLGDTVAGDALTQRLSDGQTAGLLQMLSMIPSGDQATALRKLQTAVQIFGAAYKYVVDWEPAPGDEALDFDGLFALLHAVKNQTTDARPLLYLNNDYLTNRLTDDQISQLQGIGTELWYARYANVNTANTAIAACPLFVRYWQCSCPDDDGCHGVPPLPSISGNRGADYSRFNGTEEQFQAGFPFKVTSGDSVSGLLTGSSIPDNSTATPTVNPVSLRGSPSDSAVHSVTGSSFADPADVATYERCKANGGTEEYCLSIGDNGIGYWGDDTKQGSGASCALSPEWMIATWGSVATAHLQPVLITNPTNGQNVTALIKDTLPHQSPRIDMNPDTCAALGLTPPVLAPVTWQVAS